MTYRLRDSLAYLLSRAGGRSSELFSERLLPYGITLGMYRVLVALNERADQRLSDLSAMTSIEISTLSRLVGTMRGRGLLVRERVDGDGRSVTISLTATGRVLAAKVIPLAVHHEEVGFGDLDPGVVAQLKRSLVAIHDNLDALELEYAPPAAARPGAAPPDPAKGEPLESST